MPSIWNAGQIKMRILPGDDDGGATTDWNRAMELTRRASGYVSPDNHSQLSEASATGAVEKVDWRRYGARWRRHTAMTASATRDDLPTGHRSIYSSTRGESDLDFRFERDTSPRQGARAWSMTP